VPVEVALTDGAGCVAGSETLDAADPQAATMQAAKAATTNRVAVMGTTS
jgi:hypothetical protein